MTKEPQTAPLHGIIADLMAMRRDEAAGIMVMANSDDTMFEDCIRRLKELAVPSETLPTRDAVIEDMDKAGRSQREELDAAWERDGISQLPQFQTMRDPYAALVRAAFDRGYLTCKPTASETLPTRDAVLECQRILSEYIVPDSGISDHECINRLFGVLDSQQLVRALKTAPQGVVAPGDVRNHSGDSPTAAAASIRAHSKSEFKRLDAMGADVVQPVRATPNTHADVEAALRVMGAYREALDATGQWTASTAVGEAMHRVTKWALERTGQRHGE